MTVHLCPWRCSGAVFGFAHIEPSLNRTTTVGAVIDTNILELRDNFELIQVLCSAHVRESSFPSSGISTSFCVAD